MRLLWNNAIDNAGVILTPDSEPITSGNVQTQNRKRVWRTEGATNERIIVDLGDPSSLITCCGLTGYNLSSAATVQLECSTNGSDWSALQTNTVGQLRCLFFFFSLQEKRYWRLTLNDPANVNGYLEIGRIFLGQYWDTFTTPPYGWSFQYVDRSDVKYSLGRQKWTNQRESYAQITFHVSGLHENDAIKQFLNMARRIGLVRDCFLLLLPDGGDTYLEASGMYGRFTNILGLTAPSTFIYDTQSIVFAESI